MINLSIYPIFKKCKDTLRNTSKDDANTQYMIDSEQEVINFDMVKTAYTSFLKLSNETATSIDALLPVDKHILFIEFKNGKVVNRDLKDKARDSLLIFLDIIGKGLAFSRNYVDFIVVYNYEKNEVSEQELIQRKIQDAPSKDMISSYIHSKAKEPFIRFGLEGYQKLYFREVRTYAKGKFESYLETLSFKQEIC